MANPECMSVSSHPQPSDNDSSCTHAHKFHTMKPAANYSKGELCVPTMDSIIEVHRDTISEMPANCDIFLALNTNDHANAEEQTAAQNPAVQPGQLIDLIPGKLSFTSHNSDEQTRMLISKHRRRFYFSSYMHESYQPFALDFGPVNLGVVFEFCQLVNSTVNDSRLLRRHVVYYCENSVECRTNTAFLMAAYMVVMKGCTPEDAYNLTCGVNGGQHIMPFHDATFVQKGFELSVLDCLRGLVGAMKKGWIMDQMEGFDIEQYFWLDHPDNGDIHQLVPERFIAFKGPNDKMSKETDVFGIKHPRYYVKIFQKMKVKAVIRLNESDSYDPTPFTEAGINHYNCYFDDCTVPSAKVVKQFLDIVDKEGGAIAVHCLAGLGRTGTLIALWMMKEHGVTSREAIGWLRICRPGSIIGQQQYFLEAMDGCTFHADNTVTMRKDAEEAYFANVDAANAKKLASQVCESMKLRDHKRSAEP